MSLVSELNGHAEATVFEAPSPAPQQLACLMALSGFKGIGARTLLRLLSAVNHNIDRLWQADEAFLKTQLNRSEKQQFIEQRHALAGLDLQSLLNPYAAQGVQIISFYDAAYPQVLREIYDPPLILYLRGNAACLSLPQLAVVGNRKITDYGRRAVQSLISQIASVNPRLEGKPLCITSGLAEGIDGQAHQSAIDYGLPTLAVFGCGIDKIFPAFHQALAAQILQSGGALVSEYPLGTPGSKYTFPQRNRIVAGLSKGILVVEGSAKSGSLITARQGLEEGRQIFAVPGEIFSAGAEGPNELIRQGATPVTCGQHILEALALEKHDSQDCDEITLNTQGSLEVSVEALMNPTQSISALNEAQRQLFLALPESTQKPEGLLLETLALELGWPLPYLSEQVMMLELEGYAQTLPGSRVVKTCSI
ncbi:MAG: DNA-processing protein DprA [Vampirovibrionales bacterium]|nr:DNA-processing protein DprA [Vampirovibrionales bacterium]